jgi:c-di-GMP-binding flagellar brake protein YcgR
MSNGAKEFYQSRVVEISPKSMYVEIPLHYLDHRPCSINVETPVWVEFHAPDGATCRYQTVVHGFLDMPMKVWQIDSPEVANVEREQRREFVRVLADLEVVVEIQQTGRPIHAKLFTRDISGGGMSILIPRTIVLHAGEQIEVKFVLPLRTNRFEVNARCLVVRVSDRNDRGFASASAKFVDMKESIRQRIVQYTFMRQRALNNLT